MKIWREKLTSALQGCATLLRALCAAVRDEPRRPVSRRGGRHGTAGDAGAGLVQPLQGRLAEQGILIFFFSLFHPSDMTDISLSAYNSLEHFGICSLPACML